MRLSEVICNLDGKMIADGEFTTLNYCTARSEVSILTFFENAKLITHLKDNESKITCIICNEDCLSLIPDNNYGIFVTKEPKAAFHMIHNSLVGNPDYCWPTHKTVIGDGCLISPLSHIAPHNVTIGKNVFIGEFVSINEYTIIGDNCKIHSGTIIGGKSFVFARQSNQCVIGMQDLGYVVIEDDVEICSNCHIARGTLPTDSTVIGKHTKLDALVHIGHGTKVGKRVFITAGAQVAGNAIIGDDVWIGVNAAVSNRLVVGDKARISLGSVVTRSVPEGETVTGNFAINHQTFMHQLKTSIKS